MYTFKDAYHNQVFLSFERSPFSKTPRHVWVVCRYEGQWLLTNHSKRGLEFPGGKLELEETPEEAAVREVFEETGGEVENLSYIGQYKVVSKGKTIIKNIYFANISKLVPKDDYMETKGPVVIREIPEQGIQKNAKYSFIMKDNVLQYVMKHVKRTFL
ncbi:nucleoside triphosphatase YtkD [Priestia flexa]|uniref:Nucleoside triphosphatase YtkD n=1 Tax=Priestia flexa TaxID=86664 RepID=A0A8I1MD71_9BACI|nr:nucleoside triphosphatase YtkD [Priestia flexa]MBN8250767.1 nucleoside triphosphatase YtkD [Priestia flexa]MBN8436015.1 nucleoside triphosphatase YtkD [Priestia flexa]MCA0968536.1 nucleoside triphosphatase YtkD [Priestia flexa]RIV10922.1 nucleoside triphosphatase YtkD [Priestia flexa]UIR29650.1 nucleoside triphosphatase YtkD [Priestia flexa]